MLCKFVIPVFDFCFYPYQLPQQKLKSFQRELVLLPRENFTYLGIEEGPRLALCKLGRSTVRCQIDTCLLLELWRVLLDQRKSEITVLLLTLHATMGSFYALTRTTLRSFKGVMSELETRRYSLMLFPTLAICLFMKM